MNAPPATFWSIGQSFLIIAPVNRWSDIVNQATNVFAVSPFDVYIIGQSGNPTIEEARALRAESVKFPSQGKIRLCIVRHIDASSPEAANALLKCIEEPPHFSRIVLLATSGQVPTTIRSRCSVWRPHQDQKLNALVLPLENDWDFGTVSLKIGELVGSGHGINILDTWTQDLLENPTHQVELLHWLIEVRALATITAINIQAFLEYAFLAYRMQWPLLESFETIGTKHRGHI